MEVIRTSKRPQRRFETLHHITTADNFRRFSIAKTSVNNILDFRSKGGKRLESLKCFPLRIKDEVSLQSMNQTGEY